MRGGGRLSADRKPPIPGREPCPGDTAKPDAKHPQPSGLLHRTLGTNSACCNHRERLGIDGRRARELTFEGGAVGKDVLSRGRKPVAPGKALSSPTDGDVASSVGPMPHAGGKPELSRPGVNVPGAGVISAFRGT